MKLVWLVLLLLGSAAVGVHAQFARPDGTEISGITGCAEGQIPKVVGGVWSCAADGGGSLPAGLIAAFNGACPSTWTEVTGAQGRIIVGLPSGGTLAGTVGTAYTDQQNKSVTPTFTGSALPTHTHTFTGDSLSGGTRKGGTSNPASIIENNAAVTGTNASVSAGTPSGSVSAVSSAGVLAYVQYRYCSKD